MSKIDPNEAPDGFVAVEGASLNSCIGCWVHENMHIAPKCADMNCLPHDRKDGQSVIFKRKATAEQPKPKSNNGPAVWDIVISEMKMRDNTGRERYGTPLQPHNGRDALRDAYEEALDLAVYLRQAIYERDGK